MTEKVIILRGTSGSGKTTWAKRAKRDKLQGVTSIVSADNYFYQVAGDDESEYDFDPNRLQEAHDLCFGKFMRRLRDGLDNVIVDNTNMTLGEVNPYRMVARFADAAITVVEFRCPPEIAARRSDHLPDDNKAALEVVERQLEKYEELPSYFEADTHGVDTSP
ncbi:MAG: ATP-binding protein [Bradymonadaceae bacterium]